MKLGDVGLNMQQAEAGEGADLNLIIHHLLHHN